MAGEKNYLRYIPAVSPLNTWDAGENGLVTVHMVHRGFWAWIARRFFGCPEVSHITLDAIGSFIFRCMDGTRTVGDLAELVRETFGAEAEPLYSRLVEYLQILRNNKFIYYAGEDRIPG